MVAAFKVTGDTTMTMPAPAGSTFRGAAVAFPPGSLAIDTEITLEEGAPLASEGVMAELGMGAPMLGSAVPVMVTAASDLDAAKPFTIELPLPDLAALADPGVEDPLANLAVLFKCEWVTEGKVMLGILPRAEITVEGGVAKVTVTRFGVYQAVLMPEPVTEKKRVEDNTPLVSKGEAQQAPTVVWSDVTATPGDSGATFAATVDGLGSLRFCSAIVERDGARPYHDMIGKLEEPKLVYAPKVSGSFRVRFECGGMDGRMSPPSPWSAPYVVP
jgi:hypothetical protein